MAEGFYAYVRLLTGQSFLACNQLVAPDSGDFCELAELSTRLGQVCSTISTKRRSSFSSVPFTAWTVIP